VDVNAVLADFAYRGIRLIPDPPKLIVEPASRLTDRDRAAIREHKPALLAVLTQPRRPTQDLIPGQCILEVCRKYGVAIRLDENGDIVVGKAGAKADEPTQPWPGLLAMLEMHLGEVCDLLAVGWELRAEFRDRAAA
jgi:hypothetical protein